MEDPNGPVPSLYRLGRDLFSDLSGVKMNLKGPPCTCVQSLLMVCLHFDSTSIALLLQILK